MDISKELSRRTFLAGAAVAGAAVAGASLLAGCDTGSGGTAGKIGGTFAYYINEPAYIDPYNLQESEGTGAMSNVFDSLLDYDYRTSKIIPAAAESYEVSPDATVFTFKLREGATFHNGDPVTAADFKRGWERICNPTLCANPSEISYHLGMVKGYDEMLEGKATELTGAKAVDETTFEVTLTAPYADFVFVITHPALAPVPKAAEDFDTYSQAPIGNGPFKLDGKWEHDQYIRTLRFDDYKNAAVALLDGVDYKIFAEVDTAYAEFQAGNLDFTQIANGHIEEAIANYGESADGYTSAPGQQTLLGTESSTYYLLVNNKDDLMKNQKVREALSYAINRQAICDAIFFGTRIPADGIVPPGIAGYRTGVWKTAVYDVDKAKAALAEAGYPGGEGMPEITLSYNTGGAHEAIMQMVQADFKAIGVTAKLNSMEWGAYLAAAADGKIQIGRLGWIADYPIMENFLYSLFYTDTGDNRAQYSNPDVDRQIMEARGIVDDAARIAAFQKVDDLIQSTTPVIPVMFYRHTRVASARVNDFYFAPDMKAPMNEAWLTK